MGLTFYQNYLDNISKTPNQQYIENFQAMVSQEWTNTTQLYSVEEQNSIGDSEYQKIQVWVDSVIDMNTGTKQSDDFKKFSFEDFSHDGSKGLMYQYSNNYWITINTSDIGSITKSIYLRRCNNTLRYIDKDNGSLIEIPCVIEYDVGSPQPFKDKDAITPNNHLILLVQGNDDTNKLKVNQRFIFNGRPWKLVGYNNSLLQSLEENTTLLYYDLFLDEKLPSDDLIGNIANRYEYDYQVNIVQSNFSQVLGSIGKLDAVVTFNGQNIDRQIIWSSNENAKIDSKGNFELIGIVGSKAVIKASIGENTTSYDQIEITIVGNIQNDKYELLMNPLIEEISQFEEVVINFNEYKNGSKIVSNISVANLGEKETYKIDVINQNSIKVTCLIPSETPLKLTFTGAHSTLVQFIKLEPAF